MFKSCSYCGRIHKRGEVCHSKPKRKKEPNNINKFRWSRRWTTKRKQINKRDNHMCQICIRKLYNTQQQYNFTHIEVHHIVPIHEDWDRRLDDDNLISLCAYHHKMADSGQIPRDELLAIAEEQEKRAKL